MINVITLHGHLGFEPDLNYCAGDNPFLKNILCVKRNYKEKGEGFYRYDRIPIVVRGKCLEALARLHKGESFCVTGRLITTEGKKGNDAQSFYVDVHEIDL